MRNTVVTHSSFLHFNFILCPIITVVRTSLTDKPNVLQRTTTLHKRRNATTNISPLPNAVTRLVRSTLGKRSHVTNFLARNAKPLGVFSDTFELLSRLGSRTDSHQCYFH